MLGPKYSIRYILRYNLNEWRVAQIELKAANSEGAIKELETWRKDNLAKIVSGEIGMISLIESKIVAVELPLG